MIEIAPKKPVRRLWQIHLSTALLLMGLTACLLKMNLMPSDSHQDNGEYSTSAYGWPIQVLHYDFKGRTDYENKTNAWDVNDVRVGMFYRSITVAALTNIGISISLLMNAYVLCEYLIHRREGRKP